MTIQLDILAVGNLERDGEGKILVANSTSVLIRTPDHLIVVDPSTKYMKPMVKTSFKQIGVFPHDVDIVILTHAHADHTENLGFYKKAKVYIHSGSDTEFPGATVVDDDEFQICEGVRMVHTPGHSPGHLCYYERERGYLFTGDLVYEGTLYASYPSTDPAAYLASLERVAALPAGRVFPGHYSLDIRPGLIVEIRDAFRRLDAAGALRHGSGRHDLGRWAIEL